MPYSDARTALLNTIGAVSGVENVYGYLRHVDKRTAQRDLVVNTATRRLHTWQLTRVSAPSAAGLDGDVTRSHVFRLHGWYEVEDAATSEHTFQLLCDAIMDAINAARTLSSAAHVVDSATLETFSAEMYTGVLCHHAVIEIIVEDDVDP